jgi:protein-disulfide isomerase
MRKLILAIAAMVFAAGLAGGLHARTVRAAAPGGYDSQIRVSPDGNTVMGNPDAPLKLVEFISYTCPHCAEYNAQSMAELRGEMVRKGQVSIELRPIVRSGMKVDLVAGLLALCGPANKHFGNNDAILESQAKWLTMLTDAARRERWNALPPQQFNATVAHELGLDQVMLQRGYTQAQIDACLADQAKADHIMQVTNYAFDTIGVSGTPSFMINDSLLSVFDWGDLEAILQSMMPT